MTRKKVLLSLAYILIVSALFLLVEKVKILFQSSPSVNPYLSLGFLIIVALLCGMIAKSFALPSLTGYLIAGMLFGPHLFGIISESDISALELVNSLALSFIAITAGGELRLDSLKKNISAILTITFFHLIIIVPVVTGFFYLLLTQTSLIPVTDPRTIFIISMLLGTIATAKSPASTIAIINEYRSKGVYTDVVLGITMFKDTIVLIVFALSMAFAAGLTSNAPFSIEFLFNLLGHILLSGAMGVVYGFLMVVFFKYIAREVGVFIVLASFLAHDFASLIGLEHMFMCMVAGFVVQNFSKQGHKMIESIEDTHLPIYVIFFAIAGAGLNFTYFKTSFLIVILFVILRLLLTFFATYLGAAVVKAPPKVKKYAWMGFVTNAGLTLSMVIIIEQTFPTWGVILKAIVISVIAINQILGPVLFKYGLLKSGEATRY